MKNDSQMHDNDLPKWQQEALDAELASIAADKNYLMKWDDVKKLLDRGSDFWDALPEHVKADVADAKLQSQKGEGRTNAEVFRKYEKYD